MSRLSKAEIQEQTQQIIDYFRGKPGEFYMLKGILSMNPHDWEVNWTKFRSMQVKMDGLFDDVMIARRMDEVNRGE